MNQKSDPLDQFESNLSSRLDRYAENKELKEKSAAFMQLLIDNQYGYNFYWAGVPVIQIPQELQALQEIIWKVRPTRILETGVAFGGSLVHSASMLALLEYCSYIEEGHVIGIDVDIREHNRLNLSRHPLSKKITLIEGSSIDNTVQSLAWKLCEGYKTVVILDSNHTHSHVLEELRIYSRYVATGSYLVVGDTGIEDFLNSPHQQRPWGKGNSPKTAVQQFLRENDSFEVDLSVERKLVLTGSPSGYLKRIR